MGIYIDDTAGHLYQLIEYSNSHLSHSFIDHTLSKKSEHDVFYLTDLPLNTGNDSTRYYRLGEEKNIETDNVRDHVVARFCRNVPAFAGFVNAYDKECRQDISLSPDPFTKRLRDSFDHLEDHNLEIYAFKKTGPWTIFRAHSTFHEINDTLYCYRSDAGRRSYVELPVDTSYRILDAIPYHDSVCLYLTTRTADSVLIEMVAAMSGERHFVHRHSIAGLPFRSIPGEMSYIAHMDNARRSMYKFIARENTLTTIMLNSEERYDLHITGIDTIYVLRGNELRTYPVPRTTLVAKLLSAK